MDPKKTNSSDGFVTKGLATIGATVILLGTAMEYGLPKQPANVLAGIIVLTIFTIGFLSIVFAPNFSEQRH